MVDGIYAVPDGWVVVDCEEEIDNGGVALRRKSRNLNKRMRRQCTELRLGWRKEGEYSDYDNAKFKLQETINYTDHTAVIFNLLEYHNATNETNDYRFHCQFSTDIPFNEIVELYDKGKLFKLN